MNIFTRKVRTLLLSAVVLMIGSVSAPRAQETAVPALLKIAVYVFGEAEPVVSKAMATRLIAALANCGRYQAFVDYKNFYESVAAEQGGARFGGS